MQSVKDFYPKVDISDIDWEFCTIQCREPFKNSMSEEDPHLDHVEFTHFVETEEIILTEGNIRHMSKIGKFEKFPEFPEFRELNATCRFCKKIFMAACTNGYATAENDCMKACILGCRTTEFYKL